MIRKLFIVILVLIITSSVLRADTLPGYDVLGVARYCDVFLRAPKLPALSTLLSTFGDPLPCVEKRIKQGGVKLVQVDLIDATCWRNGSCAPGVPKPTDTTAIKKRAKLVQALASKYPSIEWWISPALEHDVRDAGQVKKMFQASKAGCPQCKLINSPFTGAQIPAYPIEKHGTKVKGFSVSGDGQSSFDGDNMRSDGNGFEHRVSGSYTTFLWWNELNLRCTGEEHAPPPMQRTNRPTLDQFKQGYQISLPEMSRPSSPSQCTSLHALSGGEIYKPRAEAYCNGQPGQNDPRGNRPLLIIKKPGRSGETLPAYRSDGRKVGCFKYYGPYQGGLHRWYMGNCSGQTPTELMEDFGNEWGFVGIGGGKCIPLNSVRRSGSYR